MTRDERRSYAGLVKEFIENEPTSPWIGIGCKNGQEYRSKVDRLLRLAGYEPCGLEIVSGFPDVCMYYYPKNVVASEEWLTECLSRNWADCNFWPHWSGYSEYDVGATGPLAKLQRETIWKKYMEERAIWFEANCVATEPQNNGQNLIWQE